MKAIVAIDQNGAIGYRGSLLVSQPSDMRFFRSSTLGKPVIMGRKTFESLPGGKPLEGRQNIVLSKTLKERPGITVVKNLSELKRLPVDWEDAMVIGGEEVYRQLLPYCTESWVTRRNVAFEADRFFPDLKTSDGWEKAEVLLTFTEKGIATEIIRYQNTRPRTFF